MRYLSIAALLALTIPEMARQERLVYWECNGVARETTVAEMLAIGCDSSVFTIADGGDQNPQATPYGQKTPKALPSPSPASKDQCKIEDGLLSCRDEGYAVVVLDLAIAGGMIPRGQVCYLGVQCGLLVAAGHDGLGGTAYNSTDEGLALKKRVERDAAREKIMKLQEEIRKLETVANG